MAVVMRGWSRTASTALKLATAERIIGYQFKNVDRLYEALDQGNQRMSSPSGTPSRLKPRNFRLAVLGDALGKVHMAQDWYDANLAGPEWTEISTSTLSNDHLGQIGFNLGLNECAISKVIVRSYDMATTMEALMAAVHMDGASQDQCRKVYARLGVQHKLVDPIERLWIWKEVESKLDLPDKFFVGHHLKLEEGIFETQLKRLPVQKKDIGLWGNAKWLWERAERMWKPHMESGQKPISQRRLRRPLSRSATQTGSLKPLAERAKSVATRTTAPPSLDVATNESGLLGDDSPGRCEEHEKAAAPKQKTAREVLAKEHGAAEASTSKVPTSSKPTKRPPQLTPPKEETSTDESGPAETGSQDSNTACEAPNSSSKDVAAAGVDPKVEHQSHEASEAEPVEATDQDDSDEKLKRISELKKEFKMLRTRHVQMEHAFRDLRIQGLTKTKPQLDEFLKLRERRIQVLHELSEMNKQLGQRS